MPRQKSALALYLRTLRADRGMTQEELADMAGVNVATIKNLENDRGSAFTTLAEIYRDGIKKPRRPLTDAEWLQAAIYWMVQLAGDGGRVVTLEGVKSATTTVQKHYSKELAALIHAAEDMTTGNLRLLASVAKHMKETKELPSILSGIIQVLEG